MPTPASVTAYDINTGLPLDGLAPVISSVRHNADGTWTVLSPRAGAGAGNGSGAYVWNYSDVELLGGTFVRWSADFGDPQVTTSRFYNGELDGAGLGFSSGIQLAAGGVPNLQVTPAMKRVKVGDNALLEWAVFLDDGSGAFDLTGCSVKLFAQTHDGTVIVNGVAMSVLDVAGLIGYAPAGGDVSVARTLCCNFEVTLPDTTKRTAPSAGYAALVVEPKL